MENIKTDWKKIITIALCVLLVWGCGFFLGRKTFKSNKVTTTIEYIKGETIHDSIPYPVPYKVIAPIDTLNIIQKCIEDGIYAELFPTKIVTEYVEVTKEDTTKILQDWASIRSYNETLFDADTLGKCVVNTEVQYNRMRLIGYEYTPITKTVNNTEYKVRAFTPFIGAGVSSISSVDAVAGFFIKESWGFSVDGSYYFNPMKIENMPQWSVGVKILKEF